MGNHLWMHDLWLQRVEPAISWYEVLAPRVCPVLGILLYAKDAYFNYMT